MWMAFGSSSSTGIAPLNLALVNNDTGGIVSEFLQTGLQNEKVRERVKVVPLSLKDAKKRMRDGDFSAIVVIPEKFTKDFLAEKNPALTLIKNPTQMIYPEMAETFFYILKDGVNYFMTLFYDEYKLVKSGFDNNTSLDSSTLFQFYSLSRDKFKKIYELFQKLPVKIEGVKNSTETRNDQNSSSFIMYVLPGMSFFFLFFFANSVLTDYVKEREKFILKRLFVSKLSHSEYLAARFLSSVLFIFTIEIIMSILANLIFSLRISNLLNYGIFLLVAAILITALFLILAGLTRNERQMSNISSIFIFFFAIIGGGMVPVNMLPDFLQRISFLSPIAHLKNGVVALLANNPDQFFTSLYISLLIMLGCIVFAYVLNIRSLRRIFK
jgi:ABC-type Na+ efflux pump permease subunit